MYLCSDNIYLFYCCYNTLHNTRTIFLCLSESLCKKSFPVLFVYIAVYIYPIIWPGFILYIRAIVAYFIVKLVRCPRILQHWPQDLFRFSHSFGCGYCLSTISSRNIPCGWLRSWFLTGKIETTYWYMDANSHHIGQYTCK